MKLKRISTVLLTSILAFTTVFAGACEKENTGAQEAQSLFTNGIHYLNYTETEDDFIKDGKTEYKLLVERGYSNYIEDAITDFKMLFNQATGIDLPVVYADETYFDLDSKFISIGKNRIFNQTGIATDEFDLDRHGYIIKTFHKSIFITGDFDRGTMYGMYQFLEMEFNFDCFSNVAYYIDEGVTDKKLKNYDVTDVPDIKNRAGMNSFITSVKEARNRTRVVGRDEESFLGSSSAHTTHMYFPFETYGKFTCENVEAHTCYNDSTDTEKTLEQFPDCFDTDYHPEWYEAGGTQLCFTAHGDEESRQLLLEKTFEFLKAELIKNDEGYMFIFSQMDHGNWCTCGPCATSKETYGTNAAVVIKFNNELAQMTREWMATEEGKPYAREFQIMFLAYQHTEEAPVTYDKETKTYAPVDESVVCGPNVSVMFAPGSFDYQNSLFHEINANFRASFDGWQVVSDRFNIYRYQTNYNYRLIPYDVFSTTQEFYQYAAACETYWMFDEGQRNQIAGATGWTVLKNYLCSKLQWDTNADLKMLTDRFFDKCYGAGSESMRKMYDEYRVHSRELINNYDFTRTNSLYHTSLQKQYWSKQLLDRWLGYINDAIADIEYLKKIDMEAYQTYYDCIVMERVSIYFLIVNLYGKDGRYSTEFIEQITVQLNEDMNRLGISAGGGII